MMSVEKVYVLVINLLLNTLHYLFNWIILRLEKKKFLDDISKLGADIAFIGVTFMIAARFDVTSRFFGLLDENNSKVGMAQDTLTFLLTLSFYLLSVVCHKIYEKEKRRTRRLREHPKIWYLVVSYTFGVVILVASIILM